MIESQLGALLAVVLTSWLALVFLAVVWQLASGRIVFAGILGQDGDGEIHLHKLQLIVVTLLFAGGYLVVALSSHGKSLPDIPNIVLLPMLGSQAGYLSGKYLGLGKGAST